jgi:branched-chain amino acid transport system ATP-binding protein/neutral amino acid transport system ATP-binding protein
MGLLTVEGIVAGYSSADEILKGVGIAIEPGEIVSIIGPNGAGKSTLLKVIAGILKPRQGSVRFRDHPIAGRLPREICAMGVAFVPQEHNIFPSMSVRENLEMGGFVDFAGAKVKIEGIFGRFPILAEKRRHAARTLSGGQRQMLAMAMALMVEPKLLLLDEPSAGLSPVAAEKLFETVIAINKDGVAIAMVEQNAHEALSIAHRGYILVDGRNNRDGNARDLIHDPEVRRAFLGG